jgi:geranyl-CoA carboxylase alpha subunit
LLGLKNNGQFLSDLVNHPSFRGATMTTTLIDEWQEQADLSASTNVANAAGSIFQRTMPDDTAWGLAAAMFSLNQGAGWRPNSVASFDITLRCEGQTKVIRVLPDRSGQVVVTWSNHQCTVNLLGHKDLDLQSGEVRFETNGVIRKAIVVLTPIALHVNLGGASFVFTEGSPFPDANVAHDASRAVSSVAGKVTQVLVAEGAVVTEGQMLVCVEAMKMEMWVAAQAPGIITAVHVKAGDQVESGALLATLEINTKQEAT